MPHCWGSQPGLQSFALMNRAPRLFTVLSYMECRGSQWSRRRHLVSPLHRWSSFTFTSPDSHFASDDEFLQIRVLSLSGNMSKSKMTYLIKVGYHQENIHLAGYRTTGTLALLRRFWIPKMRRFRLLHSPSIQTAKQYWYQHLSNLITYYF